MRWFSFCLLSFLMIAPALAEDVVLLERYDGPPAVTCEAWTAIDAETGETIVSHKADEVLRPASTTKIMTSYLVFNLAAESPEVMEELVTFSRRADKTGGSSSTVREGEQVSVRELLYGLLLPSGNDASVALAEHFGDRLSPEGEGTAYDRFVAAMNRQAESLRMNDTHYVNPHGLDNVKHVTTAADMARLAQAAMQIPDFRKVVRTPEYHTAVTQEDGEQRVLKWRNTNKLLPYGYLGVKTGWTTMAGACLVSCSQRDGRELILVVLKSSCRDSRFTDSRNLWRWIWTDVIPDQTAPTLSGS
ncbi:MAG: D-alanyl-D-alanine carboxypeptidase family protein [Rubinisphaera brasiliensis]|uniref:D-alanyl-D-alanine carboxypeptidase family protein n=1 Tax=Rubinisphaera brasiliensis TaxID=119 RepID=UPI003918E17C